MKAVLLDLVVNVISWFVLNALEHRSSCISLFLLRIAAALHEPVDREEFIDEALGNLSRLEGNPPASILHAVQLIPAALWISAPTYFASFSDWQQGLRSTWETPNSRMAGYMTIPLFYFALYYIGLNTLDARASGSMILNTTGTIAVIGVNVLVGFARCSSTNS